MEKKSYCCSGRSNILTPCAATPKMEPVQNPKKEEDVKTEAIKKEGVEDAKGSLPCETVKKEEAVEVNVGSGGGGGGGGSVNTKQIDEYVEFHY
ncbi:hypothetical protein F0562_033072 [Nyssa sinensis]|uniref:Uncharacterized protein n=1 Tax=Nyssa sinensis TaxID=561372 RepID=A0A5J5AUW8_9ASTE|nr:hypothetical protein F0562_033072 [Nyssa sinensis]